MKFTFQVDVLARIVDREVGVGLSKWASADEIESALVTVRDQPKWVDTVYTFGSFYIFDNSFTDLLDAGLSRQGIKPSFLHNLNLPVRKTLV